MVKRKRTFGFLITAVISVSLLAAASVLLKPKVICANSISCVKDLSGQPQKNDQNGIFMGTVVQVPERVFIQGLVHPVLGETSEEKTIYIDLSAQRLYAYQGERLVYDFLVSTGKWSATPTGIFSIWTKLRYTRMVGGDKSIGTYYNLPNVPYTMFFYNNSIAKARGYGIHGAYWHNNFGRPMSHGCINMKIEEAEQLFYWADPPVNGPITYVSPEKKGTKIVIYGSTPNS